jgi:hypothetical protein
MANPPTLSQSTMVALRDPCFCFPHAYCLLPGTLNAYFQVVQKEADHLPDIFNWKPYWENSHEKVLVHTHGPKLVGHNTCSQCFLANFQRAGVLWPESCKDAFCVPVFVDMLEHARKNNGGLILQEAWRKCQRYLRKASKLEMQLGQS